MNFYSGELVFNTGSGLEALRKVSELANHAAIVQCKIDVKDHIYIFSKSWLRFQEITDY